MKTATRADDRTLEQIKEHYEIEKSLARRLRDSTSEERTTLYAEVYDELFSRVTHHPLVTGKISDGRAIRVKETIAFLKRFLNSDSTFLEVGPGDCALTFGVARFVKQAYAVDVSEEIMTRQGCPDNCELVLSDGSDIPVKRGSVDVTYSKDLLEHLHPDDALAHLQSVIDALAPGGIYICRTPNALSGPHDVSRYFEVGEATGLHLKEYTTTEIARACKSIGFTRTQPYLWFKGRLVILPLWPVVLLETIVGLLPRRLSRAIAGSFPIKRLLSRVIITK